MFEVLIDHSFFADSPGRCWPELAQAFGGGDICIQTRMQYVEKPIRVMEVEVDIFFLLHLS